MNKIESTAQAAIDRFEDCPIFQGLEWMKTITRLGERDHKNTRSQASSPASSPVGLSHRKRGWTARTTILNTQNTPTDLCRLVNQFRWLSFPLAGEPLLQTGQARLGANDYFDKVVLANQPFAPVGQADRGRGIFVLIVCLVLFVLATNSQAQVINSITEPIEFSKVAASEPGVIEKVMVKEGDKVRAGDVLAVLERKDLEQSKRIAELKAKSRSAINAAQANVKLRKLQQTNMKLLIEKGHANPLEVDQIEAQYEQALAELQAAEEASEQSQAELLRTVALLSKREVRSPIDGVVTELQKRAGEYVSSNEPQVASVVRLDQLQTRFYLEADAVESLAADQLVTVYVGNQRVEVEARVEFISPIVDPKTGLVRLNVIIDNEKRNLRSGISCSWKPPIVRRLTKK